MIERRQSLRAWATEVGISRRTLRLWLILDAHVALPAVRQGEKVLITESQVRAALDAHTARHDWARGGRPIAARRVA